ncbi:MAG: hypothetical protein H7A49_03500 [Akkermansiaceae bacterium]|nr:hypothetical protein [Akkermansiaceae bacterium]MCP5542955.1 hypothetical protein [Akkermansiaceae bacterium]
MNRTDSHEHALVGIDKCLEIVFPDPDSAPAKRTFHQWMANRYFPVHKIGRRVFLDPVEVRAALDRRFKINATSVA